MSCENATWVRQECTVSSSSSASRSGRPASASTWCGAEKPPSQSWRTFLDNRIKQLVSVDFFTVPTIRFQVLYVFLPAYIRAV